VTDRRPHCHDVEEVAAELALGILSGPERAVALDHLSTCSECRRHVDELGSIADSLLVLAPEAEPSIGFESRVLAATRTSTPTVAGRRRRAQRFRAPLRIAAAAALVLAAGSAGLLAGRAIDGEAPEQQVRSAVSVAAEGRATCRAFAFGEERAWVFVAMDAPREWTADYTVEVLSTEGVATSLGSFRLQGGHGTLGTTVDLPADHLKSIRMFDSNGRVRYEAPFTN
jgi:anti-sigma-K factor RskA